MKINKIVNKGNVSGLLGVIFFLIWPLLFMATGQVYIAGIPFIIFALAMLARMTFFVVAGTITGEY